MKSTNTRQEQVQVKKPAVNLGGWGALANFFNPLMVIGLIFLGPPGWILIVLHAHACSKMRARAEELANKAEVLRAEGHDEEALLYLQAIEENFRPEWRPTQAIQIRERTLSQKFNASAFRPLTEWQQPAPTDVLSEILTRVKKAPRLKYAAIEGKGEAFYNGEFLEYTLTTTKPLPSEMVDLVKQIGFEEYSQKTEDELLSRVGPPYEEVLAIGVIESKPELVVLKTDRNNMVTVDRSSFEYLFERYKKIRAFDSSKPVLFLEASFVHGHLWPITI
jgi:hypothetical protein